MAKSSSRTAEKAKNGETFIIEAVAAKHTTEFESISQPTRPEAPEASQLHGAKKTHEHLGYMLVTAESNSVETQKVAEKLPERRVETLSRAELLSLSEKIIVDGTSLRQIYETHLVGERGLRRLVAEHLSGGDVKKILRHEIVEHEIDFERDPAVRDVKVPDQPFTRGAATTPGKETLNKLLEKASAGLGDSQSEAAAYYKARAAFEQEGKLGSQTNRRLVDISLIVTIAVLITLVAVLYLARH